MEEQLRHRIQCFIVLSQQGYFSISMILDCLNNLSKSFNVPYSNVEKIYNEESKSITKENSNVSFYIKEL